MEDLPVHIPGKHYSDLQYIMRLLADLTPADDEDTISLTASPSKKPFRLHELEYSPAHPFAHESLGVRCLIDGLLSRSLVLKRAFGDWYGESKDVRVAILRGMNEEDKIRNIEKKVNSPPLLLLLFRRTSFVVQLG